MTPREPESGRDQDEARSAEDGIWAAIAGRTPMSNSDPGQPETQQFELSAADIRRRHMNAGLGVALGALLCTLAWTGYGPDSDKHNLALVASTFLFVGLFGLFTVGSHIRYVLNARKHKLEVGTDVLTFVLGLERTALRYIDVMKLDRQERMREGPSLRLTMRNVRYVRLVGYEDQEQLMALVEARVAQAKAAAAQTSESATQPEG